MENKDKSIIELFIVRDGRLTIAKLKNGSILKVWNIAYGYDTDDEFAHITTNISPAVEGGSMDFFFTNEVGELIEPEGEVVIFKE